MFVDLKGLYLRYQAKVYEKVLKNIKITLLMVELISNKSKSVTHCSSLAFYSRERLKEPTVEGWKYFF